MSSRKPGHREGVRRYKRYGQLGLPLGKTLDLATDAMLDQLQEQIDRTTGEPGRVRVVRPCAVCAGEGCEFCPKVS